jgi:hypothetical protein
MVDDCSLSCILLERQKEKQAGLTMKEKKEENVEREENKEIGEKEKKKDSKNNKRKKGKHRAWDRETKRERDRE